jgi:ABC-type multidrug transport system fused ATPase/permease subunit
VTVDITNPWYYRMMTLRDIALSIDNRKQIAVLGLDRWLIDEFDYACSEMPENTSYSPPNPISRGNTHLIDTIVREALDAALFVCAACRSRRPGIDLGTVIVMRSAASTISNSIINLHILIESAASEFKATKSYLECLRMTSHLRRAEKFIPYNEVGGKGMKIEARGLHFEYEQGDGREVLNNISFKIEAGETIGIVGYNG